MTTPSNRKRAKNYTPEEEFLLLELVGKYKSCIENKKSDAVVWKQKEDTWKIIEEEFAARSGTQRYWKALRDKYEFQKRKYRAEMEQHRLEIYSTGDGVRRPQISTLSSKMAALLGDSATGLQNVFDSDSLSENIDIKFKDLESITAYDENNFEYNEKFELVTSLEEERIQLIILQQQFYRDENNRAQEKHEQEILSLKLKNEILQLELAEMKSKKII